MVKRKTIKDLYINKAEYLISSSEGKILTVKIDYKTGKYNISGRASKDALEDVRIFANDLIKRKSNVNFA